MPNLTILHTNDLHGKLRPDGVERIRLARESASECLLLDAGDAVTSGNIYYRPGGEPALALMSEAGYDAMAMGNREFHFLRPGLHSKVRLARFPVLCANIRGADDDIGPSIRRSMTVERGGFRVAIFGLTVAMITRKMLASRVSPYWFEDPVDAAMEIVPSLRAEADVVIAVTHIGAKSDETLAQAVPGIDLIVGGHTHSVLAEPIRIGGASIVQAGWFAHCLGKVEISGEPGRLLITGSLLELQPSVHPKRRAP